ncbi:tumor necrosis factor receptor superfamily member 1B [Diretmus argenteus]
MFLNARSAQALSLPYQADSNGDCHNPKTEYSLDDGSNLCCSKCRPGTRQIKKCSNTSDSECVPCQSGQYIERWNYSPTCFSCPVCKPSKGLQYAQSCSGSTESKCKCKPSMYCIMRFEDPYCADCKKYTLCRPGYGVSIPGKADSNVKCARCPEGTFSDTLSFTDSCQPHTKCEGRAVVEKGNATSDTVCEPLTLANLDYSADTRLNEFTINSPEQQCLLETAEASSSLSHSSNDAETVVRMEDSSSQECESIGPLQSTIAVHNPDSSLSEPMSLISNTEPISSQPSISPQSPSQPISPQLISPVAASPHVNVNITFHIGNGSCGTPPILPTDSLQTDPDLPVGQEEESFFSMPQQEAGKQSLTAVQESVS